MESIVFVRDSLKIARGLLHIKISSIAFFLLLGLLEISFAEPPEPSEAQAYSQSVVANQILCTTTSASGAPIVYPKTDSPEVRVIVVDIPPGAETGWHQHPLPAVAYVLRGSVTVELKDGKRYTAKAGEAFAEVVDTLHNGHNYGKEPVRIIMTVIGQKGVPVTKK